MNSDLTTLKKPGDKKKADKEIQKWTPEQEELLAEWSEKATCYRWLHSRSEKRYRCRNYTFTIPVIILSTLTGTANFAMDSFVPESHKKVAMASVGAVNIFAGILSTLQNFLRYAELMESHRLSEVQWSKFGRNIAVELALDPKRRKPANDFLKVCRAEYDRLIEQSPAIDDPIVDQFKVNFKGTDINKPDMCNGLKRCKVFVPSEEDKKINMIAEVGSKLIEKSHHKTWKPVKTINSPKLAEISSKQNAEVKTEAKKELDGLKNIGRVSSFKKSAAPVTDATIDEDLHPMQKIHELVKNQQVEPISIDKSVVDIEKGEMSITDETPAKDTDTISDGTPSLTGSENKFLDGIESDKDSTEIVVDPQTDIEASSDPENPQEKDNPPHVEVDIKLDGVSVKDSKNQE
tara:strand:+ start:2633 stop:3847 length:1215 start_codon:yes stop_codon:yes gene_type:complete